MLVTTNNEQRLQGIILYIPAYTRVNEGTLLINKAVAKQSTTTQTNIRAIASVFDISDDAAEICFERLTNYIKT